TGINSRFAVILLPAKILRLFERRRVLINHKVLSGLAGKICGLSCHFVAKKQSRRLRRRF
ncbi:MAG TPA: hypothetical protein PLL23_15240, partial [Chitinophagaceae bacterium]|nr:hypothetical protein [Chitinophagaceae bacterium]